MSYSQVEHDLIYDKRPTLTCMLEMPAPQWSAPRGSALKQNVKHLA